MTGQYIIGAEGLLKNLTDGTMDEVGIWSKTLSASEVTDLYNAGAGLPYD